MKTILRHKFLTSLIAILYFVGPGVFNIYLFNKMKSDLQKEINETKDKSVEEAVLQYKAESSEQYGKFYLLIDELRSDVSELQYQSKTLDEETLYLSGQQRALEKDLMMLLKKRKK